MAQYDVIVVGVGVMGAATLHRLAQRGARALGIERFAPGHDRGSSHGESRIIRLGYFEHPSYVPLVRAALEQWRELEAQYGRKLLHVTGVLEIGAPDSTLVSGTLAASREHRLPHELLDAGKVVLRYPQFQIPDDFVGVFQPDGGYLDAEAAVDSFVSSARTAGAALHNGEIVGAIEPNAGGVRVDTDHGSYEAGVAIVTAGPWIAKLLPQLAGDLRVTRQALAWLRPAQPAQYSADQFPVFLIETRHGIHYGFPRIGDRVKLAKHHHADQTVDPENFDRAFTAADEAAIRAPLAEFLPGVDGALAAAKTCLYTMTPDGDFLIDRLPGAERIVIASPCSGHGFKFAPVIGDILADLAIDGTTRHDISRFRLARFR
jgi:sarcosine oxidase